MKIKDNKLIINIPDGMEIDVENCDFDTGVIKFRKKELCYEDIENSLDLEGNRTGIPVDDNNAFKLCATDRLMNIRQDITMAIGSPIGEVMNLNILLLLVLFLILIV